jgi:murein DD-endopeptidase MepM/ murein hydrolase activator NlpD
VKRRLVPLAALAVGAVLLLGPVAGSSAPVQNVATAQAFGIRIVVPGQSGVTEGYVSAPNDSTSTSAGFSYPADGSVLTSGAITSAATAAGASETVTATASAEITGITLFGGEVTVQLVDAKLTSSAGSAGGTGDFTGTTVSGLGGSAVAGSQLGTWGTLSIGSGVGESTVDGGGHGWHGSVSALDIRLLTDHGGLPAGTEILIGYAAANVLAEAVETPTTTTEPTKTTSKKKVEPGKAKKKRPSHEPKAAQQPPIGKVPTVQPRLTAGHYVFPVYGDSAYADTFGAPRADVSWHHGDDIFAPLGAPVLAVADGTVFSVGWNKIGGWRLWLRDLAGNEFYYAHLSAYSPYALNNAQVRAGTVLGFVGRTGDAEGTPFHLHFEIHPVGLLGLGYDGAVDPTPYLDAWRRLQDIRFGASGAWLPGLVRLTGSRAPEPGAILLQITDISSASGLDPGSLRRALAPVARGGDALANDSSLSASAGVGDLGRG